MGFFSWYTQDTGRSISNQYSKMPTFTVYMYDHEGNVWEETAYEGYGEFGGKDFYELLAQMNGLETRDDGIDLVFADPPRPYLSPNLTEHREWEYLNAPPAGCEQQGYFYDDDEDEEDCDDGGW